MSRSLRMRLGLGAASLTVTLFAVEAAFRLLGPALGVDGANLTDYQDYVARGGVAYEAQPHTVFVRTPRPGFANSLGFKDEEWSLEKEPDVLRILCLGGSTTEGGNLSKRPGQYPYLLGLELERRTGRRFDVMNAGISGWTTAETLVAWFLLLQDYAPDLVVIHHAANDLPPRNRDDFRPDYAHWRTPFRPPRYAWPDRWLIRLSRAYAWLRMDGSTRDNVAALSTTPSPEVTPWSRDRRLFPGSEASFRRNVEAIGLSAAGRGASVVLMTMPTSPRHRETEEESYWVEGLLENNRLLRELAAEHGWILADAEPWPDADPEAAAHFLDLVHLDRTGNQAKARIVADVLLARWEALREPPTR